MKINILLILLATLLWLTPSCSLPPSQNLVAAITPATTVAVARKPALVRPLFAVVSAIESIATKGEVTPGDLLASFSPTQRKHPELFAVLELVSTAYQLSYKPDSNNLSSVLALAGAIRNGLPAPAEPPSSPPTK